MSEKRKQTGTTSPMDAEAHKRAKGAINSIAKEYVCPIALELPVDPVTAEDGRVYNRADIQKHIDQSKRKKDDGSGEFEYRGLQSPMTKEPMGPNLLPAIQVRNSIRALIDSGAIEGNEGNAEQWKKVDELRTDAEGGDPEAMLCMSKLFYNGEDGIVKDDAKAYMWISRAADLDNTPAIGTKGRMLIEGLGTEQNRVEGGTLQGIAAARGHGLSQYDLGIFFHGGIQGFTKNILMAKYWLKETIANKGEWSLTEDIVTQVKRILESIEKEERGGK